MQLSHGGRCALGQRLAAITAPFLDWIKGAKMNLGRHPALPYFRSVRRVHRLPSRLERFVPASIAVMYPIRLFVVLAVISGFPRAAFP